MWQFKRHDLKQDLAAAVEAAAAAAAEAEAAAALEAALARRDSVASGESGSGGDSELDDCAPSTAARAQKSVTSLAALTVAAAGASAAAAAAVAAPAAGSRPAAPREKRIVLAPDATLARPLPAMLLPTPLIVSGGRADTHSLDRCRRAYYQILRLDTDPKDAVAGKPYVPPLHRPHELARDILARRVLRAAAPQ